MTSTTEKDRKARNFVDPVLVRKYAEYIEQKDAFTDTTDLMYIMNWCPNGLFSMYLTVLCQSYILRSPFSPLKSFLFLFGWTATRGILEERKKIKKKCKEKTETAHRMNVKSGK